MNSTKVLTKVRHIHSFQSFHIDGRIIVFFWAFGGTVSCDTEKDSIATNDTIPQNKAMLLDQINEMHWEQLRSIDQKDHDSHDEAERAQNIELKAGQIDLDYNTNIFCKANRR